MKINLNNVTVGMIAALLLSVSAAFAQTSTFTYQGRLTDGANAANGTYQMQFTVYDALSGGTQQGGIVTNNSVTVANGVFAVKLDFFPATPFAAGLDRWIEIAVRKAADPPGFTTLAPRQQLTSVPFATRALSAANADTAANATNATQLGGMSASGFIQNTTSPQASSDFNVSGTGAANIFNAGTQFNIGGSRVLSVAGNNLLAGLNAGSANTGAFNTFVGSSAGQQNTTGQSNSFFGNSAGQQNTTGGYNSFFGYRAGFENTMGDYNSFFGQFAGQHTTMGLSNSFFGYNAGLSNTTGFNNTMLGFGADVLLSNNLINATALGFRAGVSQSNSLVLGSINGVNGSFADTNVGIGTTAPGAKFSVVSGPTEIGGAAMSTTFRTTAGTLGANAGDELSLGSVGFMSANSSSLGIRAFRTAAGANWQTTAIGLGMDVDSTVRAGAAFWLHANGNVGVGTSAPTYRLEVNDPTNNGFRVLTNMSGGTVASFGGLGAFVIDTVSTVGGRVTVKENGNVGIGTASPNAKLQVAGGSVYIQSPSSLVITSPNGACWFITVNNAGALSTISVACP